MSCPFQNNTSLKILPCNRIQHPHNENIMFCTICRDRFDIRDIDDPSNSALFFLLVGIIAAVIFTVNNMTVTEDSSTSNTLANLSTEVNYLD